MFCYFYLWLQERFLSEVKHAFCVGYLCCRHADEGFLLTPTGLSGYFHQEKKLMQQFSILTRNACKLCFEECEENKWQQTVSLLAVCSTVFPLDPKHLSVINAFLPLSNSHFAKK